MRVKHLNRHVAEFAGRHNMRERDTVDQMKNIVTGMVGKRLMYSELTKQDAPVPSQFKGLCISGRALTGTIVLAATLTLGGADALAQAECDNAGPTIKCMETSTSDIDIDAQNLAITTNGRDAYAIYGKHEGTGDINIDAQNLAITTNGFDAYAIYGKHEGTGDINIMVKDGTIDTMGDYAHGLYGKHEGTGDINIDAQNLAITTTSDHAYGIHGYREDEMDQGATGNVAIGVQDGTIETMGKFAHGIFGLYQGPAGGDDIDIKVKDVTITTTSDDAYGIEVRHDGEGATGNATIVAQGGTITTTGNKSHGIRGWRGGGGGDANIDAQNLAITTMGSRAIGIYGYHTGANGDINIDVQNGSITTMGSQVIGIYGYHTGANGDINIDVQNGSITTMGDGARGIYASHSGMGRIHINVDGGAIHASGADASGIQIGRVNANSTDTVPDGTVERVAGVGEDGYRKQSVKVNGRVFGGSGEGAGVYIAGGGRIMIGPVGSVGAESGIAILATGDTPAEITGDPTLKPKLYLGANLDGRRVAEVIYDDYILNDGGETTIVINGVKLHDGAEGATGFTVPIGARNIILREEGVTVDRADPNAWVITPMNQGVSFDRDFSADDFIEVYASRAALYETLPSLLLRLNGWGPAGERLTSPDSPIWVRLSGGEGTYAPSKAAVGAGYDFNRFETEAGMNISLGESLTCWISVRHLKVSTDVSSPVGGGDVDTEGIGLGFGTSWNSTNDYYVDSRLSLTDYDMDISSKERDNLKNNVGAHGYSLGLEAGRRFKFNERMRLTPRAWLVHSRVSIDKFTDAVNSRVSFTKTAQLAGGVGVVTEIGLTRDGGERKFTLRGSLDVEQTFAGEETTVRVSGEKLKSASEKSRVLLGLGGVYRSGRFSLSGEVSAGGVGSGNREYSGFVKLGMRF